MAGQRQVRQCRFAMRKFMTPFIYRPPTCPTPVLCVPSQQCEESPYPASRLRSHCRSYI